MIRVGTSNFVNMTAAIAYYHDYASSYRDARALVGAKLAAGEIHIGKPATKPGERVADIHTLQSLEAQ